MVRAVPRMGDRHLVRLRLHLWFSRLSKVITALANGKDSRAGSPRALHPHPPTLSTRFSHLVVVLCGCGCRRTPGNPADDEPLGITLVTGGAFGEKTGVTRVDPNSPGERAGLQVGDVVTSINGSAVAGLSHPAILQLLKNSSAEELAIGVNRGQEVINAKSSTAMILDLGIVVEKTSEGFVQVIEAFINGAGESGGLHAGDLLLECDGSSLVKLKFRKSVEILRTATAATCNIVACPQPTLKTVVRGYQSRNPTAAGPPKFYTIQLARLSLGAGEVEPLAMGLLTEQNGPRGHTVSVVEPGGCADRGGILEGDKVVQVNGQNVIQLTHAHVLGLLKKSGMTFTVGIERPSNLPPPPAESQINGPRTVMETEHFTEVEI